MNPRILAESLTITEINELSDILLDKKKEFARNTIRPLDENQRALCAEGRYIDAIKAYRQAHNSGLFEAKLAVDVYLGR